MKEYIFANLNSIWIEINSKLSYGGQTHVPSDRRGKSMSSKSGIPLPSVEDVSQKINTEKINDNAEIYVIDL